MKLALKIVTYMLLLTTIILFAGCKQNKTQSEKPDTETLSTQACTHSWQIATCTTPKFCRKCKDSEGNALGHSWKSATCVTPKTCSICSKTEGNALGHSWTDPTCKTPKTCTICNKSDGNVGTHLDTGNGRCKYCNQDILFLDLQKGFNVELIIPTVGGLNYYCTVKYTNNTKYTISSDMDILSANGDLLWNWSPDFTLQPGYYVTRTHYCSPIQATIYDPDYKELYLDNNSLAYTNVQVNGKRVFVRFGVNGPVAFGYSLAEIGIY